MSERVKSHFNHSALTSIFPDIVMFSSRIGCFDVAGAFFVNLDSTDLLEMLLNLFRDFRLLGRASAGIAIGVKGCVEGETGVDKPMPRW